MTLGDLVTKIQDDLIDVRVSQAQIVEAINESIDFYKRMTFYFTGSAKNFNMVSGREYYTVDDNANIPNIFNIDYLKLTSGNMSGNLDAVLDSQIQDAYRNGVTAPLTSTPYAYAYVRQSIRIFPIPSSSGKFTYSASEKTLTLSGMGHTNTWLTEAPELIRQAAKVRLSLNKFGSAELAQGPSAMEQKELDALLAETRKRQAQVPLRVDAGLIPATPSFHGTMRSF